MAEGVTRAELARRVGLSEATVRYHISTGRIRPLPNGRLNPRDADTLREMANVREETDARSSKLLQARAIGGAVKVRRLRLHLREERARVVERAELEAELREQARQVTARLATLPQRHAAQLADALGVDLAVASAILAEFTAVALDELGDVEAEALRASDRCAQAQSAGK